MNATLQRCGRIVAAGVVLCAAAGAGNGEALVDANTAFTIDLYGKLRAEEGNLFLSPYSISTALAMTYAGARGETARQMVDVLHLGGGAGDAHEEFGRLIRQLKEIGAEGQIELAVANALWGQQGYGFREAFLALLREHYGSDLTEVDFAGASEAARGMINAWVVRETRGKITDLIPPGGVSALTRLVLTNAIYFKGTWATQFDKEATKDAPFYLAGEDSADVPLMQLTEHFRYAEDGDVQVLELPYLGNRLSMVVLLPRMRDGLAALEGGLSVKALRGWTDGLRRRKVAVFLPRFTMTTQFSLGGTLAAMGMRDAFTQAADFTGMAERRELFISAVLHKAFVDVNEEGTEAAAATGVVIGLTSVQLPEEIVVFRADHPFLFLIRENRSGSLLFVGRVLDPRG